MSSLVKLVQRLSITSTITKVTKCDTNLTQLRFIHKPHLNVKPKPGFGIAYRRVVHYPEEYTVQPLEVTNLAGRDPVSGKYVLTFFFIVYIYLLLSNNPYIVVVHKRFY